MTETISRNAKACTRCGGPTIYRSDAVVPGDPSARRGSRRAFAHTQPAWECIACGAVEAEERRAVRIPHRQSA